MRLESTPSAVLFLLVAVLLLPLPLLAQEEGARRDASEPFSKITGAPPGGWRVPTWQNPGGWTVVDVTDHGIQPDGADIVPAFRRLLERVDGPILLYFRPGTYTLKSDLDISTSELWIRGAGANQTRFRLAGEDPHSITFSGTREGGVPLKAPLARADSTVVLGAADHGLSPGDVVEVRQHIPNDVPYYEGPAPDAGVQEWGRWGYAFTSRVDTVRGAEVTLDAPAPLSFSPVHKAELRIFDPIHTLRIEGLTFERTVANGANTLEIEKAANVLVTNVASLTTAKYHLSLSSVLDAIVRDSYVGGTYVDGGGGEGYGVALSSGTSQALVTNNVFRDLRHHAIMQIGANRSVFSYNYTQGYKGEEDFSVHGHYTHHILFEGNSGAKWGIGDWWGPTGPGFVLFRNQIRGLPDGDSGGAVGVMLWLADTGQWIVGNDFSDDTDISYRDDHAPSKNHVHANRLDGRWTDQSHLPSSLYLDEKPGFWPSDLPWPPYGPDVSDSATNRTPAQIRWQRRGDALPVDRPVPLSQFGLTAPDSTATH